jgi:hypothetical protein
MNSVCQHNEIIHLLKRLGWFSLYGSMIQAGPLRVRTPMGPRDFLFSTSVQPDFGTHLPSCTMCTWAVPWLKKHMGCGTDHPLPTVPAWHEMRRSLPLLIFIYCFILKIISVYLLNVDMCCVSLHRSSVEKKHTEIV